MGDLVARLELAFLGTAAVAGSAVCVFLAVLGLLAYREWAVRRFDE